MADIELVIRISQEDYETIKDSSIVGDMTIPYVFEAIRNGMQLPKGHGDLKDVEKLKNVFIAWRMLVHGNFTDADIASIIYNSPTIIEADKTDSSAYIQGKYDAVRELKITKNDMEVLNKIRAEIEEIHLIGYATVDGKRGSMRKDEEK